MKSPFEFIPSHELSGRIAADIDQANDRVYLRAMIYDAMGEMQTVHDAAIAASQRGASTTIAWDPISYIYRLPWEISDSMRELDTAGVSIPKVGKHMYPWTVFSGRSHTKAFIMDDIAYYGGGLNLSEASFACHDFMLRDTRPAVADQILRVMNETQVRKPQDDKVVEIDRHNKLIIDGGQPETSSILRRATELAQVAVRAWYVSQFAPDAHLLDALVAVPGETYAKYNTFHSNIGPINKIASLSNDFFARKLVNRYDGDRKIHAKCLVVELADGSLTTLTGSHNLNSEGVYLGTKEISLESTDQMLCKRLIKYIETEVV